MNNTNYELVEIAKIILPGFAIIISTISLVKSDRNTKRQVRIGKLEEIIECLQVFLMNYEHLYNLYINQLSYKNASDSVSKDKLLQLRETYRKNVKIFKSEVDMEKFQDKTVRLRVLTNSYLPNKELKLKIISIIRLITNLVNCVIYEDFERARKIFGKYPNPLYFLEYVDRIENEILKEMQLGYKGSNNRKLEDYQATFSRDLKI